MKKIVYVISLMICFVFAGCNMCKHEYGEWQMIKEVTCTEDGILERKCLKCESKEESSIQAKGHLFGEWQMIKEVTCTEDGILERKCLNCESKEESSIQAKGHLFGEWQMIKEATCTEQGILENSCENCGYIEEKLIELENHDEYFISRNLNGTSCEDGVDYVIGCKNCDYTYEGSAKDHITIKSRLYIESIGGLCDGYFEHIYCACYQTSNLNDKTNCIFTSRDRESSDFEDFDEIFRGQNGYIVDKVETYTCDKSDLECGFVYTKVTTSRTNTNGTFTYTDYINVYFFGHSDSKLLDCKDAIEVYFTH